MFGLFVGALSGLLVGGLFFCVFEACCETFTKLNDSIVFKIGISSWMVVFCVCAIIGICCENNCYESYIEEYTIVKTTIENSITNEDLGGYEKTKLVQMIVDENEKLARVQYDAKQWYGFNMPDEVLDLKPILID